MATEKCCNKRMERKVHTIRADKKGWMFDIVEILKCEKCKIEKWTAYSISQEEKFKTIGTIGIHDRDKWKTRIKNDEVQLGSEYQETRGGMIVGGWTKFHARDTAEIYKKVLRGLESQCRNRRKNRKSRTTRKSLTLMS